MRKPLLWLLLSSLCLSACNQQQSLSVNEFIKGSFAHIQQQNKGSPYLVLFWSEQCAYCMKELTALGQLPSDQRAAFKLVTVSTDPFMDKAFIREKLASFNLPTVEAWVFSAPHAETLYFDVDNRWRGELPLSFLFDAQNNKTKKMGELKPEHLTAWLSNTVSE